MYKFRKLTRDQLAKFLPDHESIKVFENINANSGELIPDAVEELQLQVGTSSANAQAAIDAINRLSNALEMLALEPAKADAQDDAALLLPPIEPTRRKRYGAFSDSTTQTAAVINTAYAVTFNTTDLSNGVYIGSPTSRIYVDEPGVYNFQFSAQLDNTAATVGMFDIWARINGADVANSNSRVRIQGNNAELVAAWNFVFNMNAGDYFELMWAADSTTLQLQSFTAAAPHPATPSVILTVTDNIS